MATLRILPPPPPQQQPCRHEMKKPIELDGSIGEGGGQIIRIAIGLAALTTQPVKITNIRGNRPRGGGLKSQHVASIQWLAEVTKAEVEGLSVGSRTLTFTPHLCPRELERRNFKISAESGAASTLLILQAILPFCMFAAKESWEPKEPITLTISGGTNVDFSLSYEYLDQVFLATLNEHWHPSIVQTTLEHRGWSLGSKSRGELTIKISPIPLGQKLNFQSNYDLWPHQLTEVDWIDVSIVAPASSHEALQNNISEHISELFGTVEVRFKKIEDSRSASRWYILLVANTAACTRLGYDVLKSMPKKTKSEEAFISRLSQQVCKGLFDEVSIGGHVDEHLQDQLIVYQALTEGQVSLPRREPPKNGDGTTDLSEVLEELRVEEGTQRRRRCKAEQPFGHGSLHSQTARWVVSEMLPGVKFFNRGDIVEGVGFSLRRSTAS